MLTITNDAQRLSWERIMLWALPSLESLCVSITMLLLELNRQILGLSGRMDRFLTS